MGAYYGNEIALPNVVEFDEGLREGNGKRAADLNNRSRDCRYGLLGLVFHNSKKNRRNSKFGASYYNNRIVVKKFFVWT